jgi:transposase
MRRSKIDRVLLQRLVNEGRSQTEIAKYFGVSRMAVYKALKKLKIAVCPHVADKAAPQVIKEHLNATQQLLKINKCAHEMLDTLMAWQRGEPVALQVLESQISKKKIWIGKEQKLVKQLRAKDPRELALKTMGVIRGQIVLYLNMLKTLYSLEAFAEFRDAFLRVLARKDPKIRDEIILELQKERLLPEKF